MLMNDKQVAVNDVIVRLREASDHYAHAAHALSEPQLSEPFEARARACSDAAAGLEPHIRRLGELPRRPDPEREALEQILTRIGASIGSHERSRFLQALGEREAAVEQAAGDALLQPLPEDTLAEMRRIRTTAREQKSHLAGMQSD
ncbi:MAG: DUF2383 domain-containing protein [Gammaproteobacteria bacterium]